MSVVSRDLVSEEGEAFAEGPGTGEAHGLLLAGLAEEAFARPQHDREDRQPAFGSYLRAPAAPGGTRRGAGLIVIALAGDRVCAMTRFESSVLPRFGLPLSLPGQ